MQFLSTLKTIMWGVSPKQRSQSQKEQQQENKHSAWARQMRTRLKAKEQAQVVDIGTAKQAMRDAFAKRDLRQANEFALRAIKARQTSDSLHVASLWLGVCISAWQDGRDVEIDILFYLADLIAHAGDNAYGWHVRTGHDLEIRRTEQNFRLTKSKTEAIALEKIRRFDSASHHLLMSILSVQKHEGVSVENLHLVAQFLVNGKPSVSHIRAELDLSIDSGSDESDEFDPSVEDAIDSAGPLKSMPLVATA